MSVGRPRGPRAIRLVTASEARRVRLAFSGMLEAGSGLERRLRGVVGDTLSHPGSLARAQLAYGTAARLGMARASALKLGIALEYFHAASLIFDDMPAMDDARVRRGRPCPHRVYGEAAATLGALALVTRAYALLWEAIADLPRGRRRGAAHLVQECLGAGGILDGQSRDVHFGRRRVSDAEILRVAGAKTIPLIRLALVLPAIAAGARRADIARLEKLSASWGLAYQVLDDFKDLLLSDVEAGKSTARDRGLGRPNLPERSGTARALARIDALLADARASLAALSPRAAWTPLFRLQGAMEDARREVAVRLAATCAA